MTISQHNERIDNEAPDDAAKYLTPTNNGNASSQEPLPSPTTTRAPLIIRMNVTRAVHYALRNIQRDLDALPI